MSPKVAIPVLVGALALAPAAFIAQRNQVRFHAFTTEGTTLRQAVLVAKTSRPLPARDVDLAPVVISAVRQARAPAALVTDALPTVCEAWRALQAGPRADAATVPVVRSCEGLDLLGVSEPPPAAARIPAPPRAPAPPHETWQFKEHVGGPR